MSSFGYDPERHHRRTLRIPGFDYTCGWYFVTICSFNREVLFAEIRDEIVYQSAFGHLAEVFWTDIPQHFPNTLIDQFIVMPNHLHGIIAIENPMVSAEELSRESFSNSVQGSLATIIRSFKSASTRSINIVRETPGAAVWQKGFYEHVIRNETDLRRIRKYIEANPSHWNHDPENTESS